MGRTARISLAIVVSALVMAAPASAGTISLTGATVSFQASPGEANHVKVTHALGNQSIVTVQDTGASIAATGVGCVAVAHRATCISTEEINAATVFAGDSEDTVAVSDFVAEVHGGDGADVITTGDLADTIYGDAGSDSLDAGGGDDVLDGGTGADTLRGGYNDFGVDTVTYADRTAPVSVTPGDGANDGEAGEGDNVEVDVERIIGGSGNDHMTGPSDFYVYESLSGGPGDDVLEVRGGAADGGPGNDTLLVLALGPIESSLSGGPGNDALTGAGSGEYLDGGDGADTIEGNDGNDQIRGAAGDDVEDGGAGNDDIDDHQGGADTVDGGPGDDRMYLRDPVDVHGGSGHDDLETASSGLGATVSLDDVMNDSMGGRASNVHSDVEDFLGTFYDDVIVGSASANRLFGALGNDTIEGKGGSDLLEGGSGDANVILARDGEPDEVSCGNGTADTAQVDPVETLVQGCETLLP
jgi:Ca2+-binding RTX toxin-like protein